MTTPLKNYGFNYEFDGKTFAFDVLAASEESAKKQAAAMANAVYVGQLHAHEEAALQDTSLAGA